MGLYRLSLIQQVLDTSIGGRMDLTNFKDQYGEECVCPFIEGEHGDFGILNWI